MFPNKKQWNGWSLPSKLTAIGSYVGVAGFLMTIILAIFNDSGNKVIESRPELEGVYYRLSMPVSEKDANQYIHPPQNAHKKNIVFESDDTDKELEIVWENTRNRKSGDSGNSVSLIDDSTFLSVGKSYSLDNYKILSKRDALEKIAIKISMSHVDEDVAKYLFVKGRIVSVIYFDELKSAEIYFKVKDNVKN